MSAKDEHLPITIDSEEVVYQRFRKVVEYHYTETEQQVSAKREIITGQHAVAVVAYDPNLEKLVMIRQFCLGAQLGTGRGMTAEIVAGLIDHGETPLSTAGRELTEETGLTAKRILAHFSIYLSIHGRKPTSKNVVPAVESRVSWRQSTTRPD